jgi:hypothetical protein
MSDLDAAIDLVLDSLASTLGMPHCMLFLADPDNGTLTAIASRGYSQQGTGAEVRWGEGVIGLAAKRAQSLRFSCVGRSFLYIDNVKTTGQLSPDTARLIPMPGLEAPQSLLVVPTIAGGEVRGLIYAEAEDRLAFNPTDEQSVGLIAAQLAAVLALFDSSRDRDGPRPGAPAAPAPQPGPGPEVLIQHYSYDDSLFIGHDYVIKGVPGRLLWRMLQTYACEGRVEFTNREFRLDSSLKLPDFKDNLEARLLLLARRLQEKAGPVRIIRHGRGRVELQVDGTPVLQET